MTLRERCLPTLGFVAVGCVLSVPIRASAAPAVTIDTCGEHRVSGDVMVGQDLDCTGEALRIVVVKKGRVFLNGNTVLNGGVQCEGYSPPGAPSSRLQGKCAVYGPGTLIGSGVQSSARHLRLEDVEIGGRVRGIKVMIRNSIVEAPVSTGTTCVVENYPSTGTMRISDSTITGGACGVAVDHGAVIRDSQILASGGRGVWSWWGKVSIRGCVIGGHAGEGLVAQIIELDRSEVVDNGGHGVRVINGPRAFADYSSMRVTNSDVSRNGGSGVYSDIQVRSFSGSDPWLIPEVTASRIHDNGEAGVRSYGAARIIGTSELFGNALDIHTDERPTVGLTVQCGTSNWSMCELD